MTFADSVKHSMIEYHSIYPTLGQCLDHMFMCIGNGYEWFGGTLSENGNDQAKMGALPEMERLATNQNRPSYNIPRTISYIWETREIPIDIQRRLDDYTINSAHGFDKDYSRLSRIPDNVSPDWLNAIWAYLRVIVELPIEKFVRYRMACQGSFGQDQIEKQKAGAEREYEQTIAASKKILSSLPVQYPDHVFEKPKITLDPNRPDIPGLKYWSKDYNTPDPSITELIKPFRDVITFAYKVTPKNYHYPVGLTAILRKAAKAAIDLGERVTNNKIQDGLFLEDHTIKEALKDFPIGKENLRFEEIVSPYIKMIRKVFRLRRINVGKAIPYNGYPAGHGDHGDPWDRFTPESMEYDKTDQGRDALTVIMNVFFTVVSELGCRHVRRTVIEVCATLPPAPQRGLLR